MTAKYQSQTRQNLSTEQKQTLKHYTPTRQNLNRITLYIMYANLNIHSHSKESCLNMLVDTCEM